MERAALLWASRGQRWGLNEGRCVVRSTPGNPPSTGSNRISTRSTPSGSRRRPISRAKRTRVGKLVRTPYDDGGLSGGTMERPVLQCLLAEGRQPRGMTLERLLSPVPFAWAEQRQRFGFATQV
jgi:hypothetical protein